MTKQELQRVNAELVAMLGAMRAQIDNKLEELEEIEVDWDDEDED